MHRSWFPPVSHLLSGCLLARFLVSVAVLLSLAGCALDQTGSFSPMLAVHCLILEGNQPFDAHVNRTFAIDETPNLYFPDADVRIWHGPDTVRLSHLSADRYCAPGISVEPGDTFCFQAAASGLDTVRAQTVVPDTFSVLFPQESAYVTINDSMVWTRRPCAGYYMSFLNVEAEDTFFLWFALANESLGPEYDPDFVRLPQMFFLYDHEPGWQTFALCALDSSYFSWVRQGGFGFGPGGAGSDTNQTIPGGVGVFGSATIDSFFVFVVPDTAKQDAGTGSIPAAKGSAVDIPRPPNIITGCTGP